jgi:5-methylcytosine-specific restriction endonuclease McrA
VEWTQDRCRPIVYARAGLGDPQMARCEKCGSSGPLSMDHLKNRSQGGDWRPSNIVVLCGSGTTGCHGWKTGNPDAAWRAGWRLLRDEEPGTRPIELHSWAHWPVLLDDDGNVTPVP